MKKSFSSIAICLIFIGCQDSSMADLDVNSPASHVLIEVTTADKTYQLFEYGEGQELLKESTFTALCDVPTTVISYSYTGSRLNKISTMEKGLYSSTITMCDPASPGYNSSYTMEYNAPGNITRVTIAPDNYFDLTYNEEGRIVQKTNFYQGKISSITSFSYDSRGNILSETDNNGQTTHYTYDDKINPYHLMEQRPYWISPFNTSPNNVIEANGATSFKRSFKYNSEDLPAELLDSNSLTYTFHYK